MIDQAIHIMDLARWFVGEPIASIQASIANRNHPEIETEDTAEGLITYRNGVTSVFFATNNFTYNAPVVIETQCEHGTALLEWDKATITYKNGRELTVVNGRRYQLEELDDQVEGFWFIQDSAGLLVVQPGVVKEGETHMVEVEIALRFPYIPIGPGKFLVNTTRCTVTQVAGGAR